MDFNSQDSQEIMKKFKSIISSRLEKLDNEQISELLNNLDRINESNARIQEIS